jgi:hypothetical protein
MSAKGYEQPCTGAFNYILNMVCEYMANRRSIILTVISAQNDHANQIVLKLAKQVDAVGKRTMGVITKSDTLPAGSESELAFMHLARNLDSLGWHVSEKPRFRSPKMLYGGP